MADQIYKVRDPQGNIREIKGPAGASDEEVIAQAKALFAVPAQTTPAAAAPAAPSGIPGPRRSGLLGSVASLADVTVGGLVPAAIQQVGYPVLRMTMPAQEAQAAVQRVSKPFEQPFGRASGTVGTAEYESSPAKQLVDFIGQNVQKGAKWLSDNTGLPVADVENMIGTLSLGAGAVAKPVLQAGAQGVSALKAPVAAGAEMALKPILEPYRERKSMQGYARGPQIEAATDAQKLGLVIDPREINPSVGTKMVAALAGEKGKQALAAANAPRIREIAVREMGLPPTAQLNGPGAFQEARALVAGPYEQVKRLPVMVGDQALVDRLNSFRVDPAMIGAKNYAPAVDSIVDSAIKRVTSGINGEELLKEVRVLRQRAQKTYKNQSATIEALDVADANLAIANSLESMIENNIFNPRLRAEFRDARSKMAQTYAYEGATDFNTGVVDVGKLARITSKDNALTGDIAALGRVAGNFPNAFGGQVAPREMSNQRLTRSGLAGTVGTLGAMNAGLDYQAAAALGLGAAGLAEGINALAARKMASPEYQAGLRLYDPRIPAPEALRPPPGQTIPTNRSLIPYDYAGQQVLPPEYKPNFVFVREPIAPNVEPNIPAGRTNLLPPPSAESTINALRAEDVRKSQLSRALGKETEARQAAAESAARQPTRGEIILDIDPTTGRLRESTTTPVPSSIPKPSSLSSAVQKLSGQMVFGQQKQFQRVQVGVDKQGAPVYEVREVTPTFKTVEEAKQYAFPTRESQGFQLTAEERVAWNKAKADLSEVAPGFKALSDKAIAEKMMDREWVQQTITKAREKTESLARQEALLTEQLANRNNLKMLAAEIDAKQRQLEKTKADRVRMMNLVEQMDDSLRVARPDASSKQQGPKTREFKRNALSPQNRNNLAP